MVPDILQASVSCNFFFFFDGYVSLLNDSGKTEITWQGMLSTVVVQRIQNYIYLNGF